MTTQATTNSSSAAADSFIIPIAEALQMAGGLIVSAVKQGRLDPGCRAESRRGNVRRLR